MILFWRRHDRRASVQAQFLLDDLDAVTADLEGGAVVVLAESRVRFPRLPEPVP